ncbi:MAG: glycosyltransferase family 1 protein [Eubacterium sp.]
MMDKIYVLVLITVMDRAGAETMMMNYLRNIDRDKIQMDFLINRPEKADYEDEIVRLGGHVYHMSPLYPGKFARYKKELREFLSQHPEYKIIHSHLEERSYFGLKIAKQVGVPVRIVHAHSVPKHFNLKLPARLYFRHKLKGMYTHRFACGQEPAKWLYGTTEDVTFMKNAIDTNKFSFNEQVRRKIRKQLKIKEGTLVIGHVGRFTYEKNHQFLIEIFREVNKTHSNCRLLLIGGGKPKEEVETKGAIKTKVEELGLDSKVRFLGVRDNVDELMQAMDLLVMPSISEGFPVTLIEAQSVGLKCLVSDAVTYKCNLTKEMQYMSLDQDAAEWANKILSFYSAEVDAQAMNEAVRKTGFDIKENAKWLEAFYENALLQD